MSPITSSSERGGYFLSSMFSYVNYRCAAPNSDALFFFFFPRFRAATYRVLEIEWAVKNGKEFVPSPRKPRKPRGKKRKIAAISFRGHDEGASMTVGEHTMGLTSLDEGDETEGGREEVEVSSLLGKIREEEYEGNGVAVETPALKRVKSDVE